VHSAYGRFEALTTVNMKVSIFWDVMPCSLVVLSAGSIFVVEENRVYTASHLKGE
jgi:hypothetical protein